MSIYCHNIIPYSTPQHDGAEIVMTDMILPDKASSHGSLFPSLLSPLSAGALRLRNRSIMGAMHTGIERLDGREKRIAAFYRARALGEVGMIVTGGVAPNMEGRVDDAAPAMTGDGDPSWQAAIVNSVHGTETRICLQILHTGRYARFAGCVAPSDIPTRINRHRPRALTTAEVWQTIEDYARTAAMAREFEYDAIEIMGSEGYLINQFTAPRTNRRKDEFGGSLENRIRFPLEVLRAVRRRVGRDFPIMYRISAVDLVEEGMTLDETLVLAAEVEKAGADILNTGVGWHESSVPTIAHVVPRAAWTYATRALREAVSMPLVASNRINDPRIAEALLQQGDADLVSMARPLLADPAFMRKVRLGNIESINTCIACNQACLDRIFRDQTASCLVNPRAGHEIEFDTAAASSRKRIAVVGGGAAGMNFAFNAAARGHSVALFETHNDLGGQLLLARNIPGKTEFDEMLRYFRHRLVEEAVEVRIGREVSAEELIAGGYEEIVIATGVRPRPLAIPGIDHPKVLTYSQALLREKPIGRDVAIVGAGGIGFDMAEFLLGEPHVPPALEPFAEEYGLDLSLQERGGWHKPAPSLEPPRRIAMLQRKPTRPGTSLAPTTGWIRRDKLMRHGVEMLAGVEYLSIDDVGLHVSVCGKMQIIPADTIIICAGQESERGLYDTLRARAPHLSVHLIGGAETAAELDATRAIDQATRLAFAI